MELLLLSEAMCPSKASFPLTYPLGTWCVPSLGVRMFTGCCTSTRHLFHAVDAKFGKVFVKRERDRERAEAELSALVRLRYDMLVIVTPH